VSFERWSAGGDRELVSGALRTVRRAGVWWAAGIVAFIVVNLAFWPSLESSAALDSFDEMESLLEAFGAQNIATPEGYVDGQIFALLLPLLLSALAITIMSGLTAGDENAGRLELLCALPVGRRRLWFSRWAAAALVLTSIAVIAGLATVVSLPVFSLTEVSVVRVVVATLGCLLLGAFHGSVTYLAASLGATRGGAAGVGVLVLVVGYLMSFVLPLAEPMGWARSWSPWYWAIGEQPITNGIDAWRLLLVSGLALLLVVVGTVSIDRRDIRTA